MRPLIWGDLWKGESYDSAVGDQGSFGLAELAQG